MTYGRSSTGIAGLDEMLDGLRAGDCVVWQVEDLELATEIFAPFVQHSLTSSTPVCYLRFGTNEPLIASGAEIIDLDPRVGFEGFTSALNRVIVSHGSRVAYIFDPLSELVTAWRSDLAAANFFRVTVPYLFQANAISYVPMIAGAHTFATRTTISDCAQVLVDVQRVLGEPIFHPLKAWLRDFKSGFYRISGHQVEDLKIAAGDSPKDYWQQVSERGYVALTSGDDAEITKVRHELIDMMLSRGGKLEDFCRRFMSLPDLLELASREIGTGFIGGKSVGMLVARAILAADEKDRFTKHLEPHDSYFLGSDLFFLYIIANGWWPLWAEQKTPTGYFTVGAQLHERLLDGKFPPQVRSRFIKMLEYYGQAPIIVRSSSLLEDNFGNAFAGKYDSVFCTNQGDIATRLREFENAVRTVYASIMAPDALAYRRNRGLDKSNEQMAILIQRVSGCLHGDYFFPHAAGVGNSSNIYVWDARLDPEAGLLRLVFGLGTRAVDRTLSDYPRLVALDEPTLPVDVRDPSSHSQRYVDVLSLAKGDLVTVPLVDLVDTDIGADWSLFASPDHQTITRFRQAGRKLAKTPKLLDFNKLLATTDFAETMRAILTKLQAAYDYPVDIEYTVNIAADGNPKINIVQCRPLQTSGLGSRISMPTQVSAEKVLISQHGNFMGGNVCQQIKYVILVRAKEYLSLSQQDRYGVARAIGRLNQRLKGAPFMIAGPGRWGTTTPSLGVPAHFTEISNAAVLAEFTYPQGNFRPELSQGSHFFQEIVEQGTFYLALFAQRKDVVFNTEMLTSRPNELTKIVPELAGLAEVLHVVSFEDLTLYSDVTTQQVICCRSGR